MKTWLPISLKSAVEVELWVSASCDLETLSPPLLDSSSDSYMNNRSAAVCAFCLGCDFFLGEWKYFTFLFFPSSNMDLGILQTQLLPSIWFLKAGRGLPGNGLYKLSAFQKHLWLEMRRMHGHTQRLFFVEYGLTVVCQIFNDAALKVIVQQDITHFNH